MANNRGPRLSSRHGRRLLVVPNPGAFRMATETPPLDTRVEIITPENIAFTYRVAGPFRRLPAYLMDVFIRIATIMLLGVVVLVTFGPVGLGGIAVGVTFVSWFLLDWFYGGLFEALWNGQTPGKRLMGIRVITIEGQPISGWQAILRQFSPHGRRDASDFHADSHAELLVGAGFVLDEQSLPTAGRFGERNDGHRRTAAAALRSRASYRARSGPPGGLSAGELAREPQHGPRVGRLRAAAADVLLARRAEIAMHLGEPLRLRFGLPRGTSHDLLLCAHVLPCVHCRPAARRHSRRPTACGRRVRFTCRCPRELKGRD